MLRENSISGSFGEAAKYLGFQNYGNLCSIDEEIATNELFSRVISIKLLDEMLENCNSIAQKCLNVINRFLPRSFLHSLICDLFSKSLLELQCLKIFHFYNWLQTFMFILSLSDLAKIEDIQLSFPPIPETDQIFLLQILSLFDSSDKISLISLETSKHTKIVSRISSEMRNLFVNSNNLAQILSKFSGLKKLVYDGSDSEILESFLDMELTSLTLSSEDLYDDHLTTIFVGLHENNVETLNNQKPLTRSLNNLSIPNSKLSSETYKRILQFFKNLTKVEVKSHSSSTEYIRLNTQLHVGEISGFDSNNTLQSLTVECSGNDISDLTVNYPSTEELKIDITTSSDLSLLSDIGSLTNLSCLIISYQPSYINSFKHCQFSELYVHLKDSLQSLHFLEISFISLDTNSFCSLAALPLLSHLSLRNCRLPSKAQNCQFNLAELHLTEIIPNSCMRSLTAGGSLEHLSLVPDPNYRNLPIVTDKSVVTLLRRSNLQSLESFVVSSQFVSHKIVKHFNLLPSLRKLRIVGSLGQKELRLWSTALPAHISLYVSSVS